MSAQSNFHFSAMINLNAQTAQRQHPAKHLYTVLKCAM